MVSDAARFGVMSGVMREARMPFGFVFDLSIVAVTRAPVDGRIRCRFAGPALTEAGQLRARTLLRQRWYGSTAVTWIDCSWWAAAARIGGSVARSASRWLDTLVVIASAALPRAAGRYD